MNNEISPEDQARLQEEEKAMLEDVALKIEAFEKDRSNLIPILQMIQEKYSYVAPTIALIVIHQLPFCLFAIIYGFFLTPELANSYFTSPATWINTTLFLFGAYLYFLLFENLRKLTGVDVRKGRSACLTAPQAQLQKIYQDNEFIIFQKRLRDKVFSKETTLLGLLGGIVQTLIVNYLPIFTAGPNGARIRMVTAFDPRQWPRHEAVSY